MSSDEPLFDQLARDPQSWNLYFYARNNPLVFTDPSGRQAEAVSPCKTTNDPSCIASVDSVLTRDKKIKGVGRAAANTAIGGANLPLWVGYGFGNATSNGAYSNSESLQIRYCARTRLIKGLRTTPPLQWLRSLFRNCFRPPGGYWAGAGSLPEMVNASSETWWRPGRYFSRRLPETNTN
jgi:hypothetical protein